jgi:hypothetical protein
VMIVHNRFFNLLEYMIKRSGLLALKVERKEGSS